MILYADASHCSKLLYWGKLTALEVHSDGTRYEVADLTPVSGTRTQELVLKSTNVCIARGYIKPYAIVRTPEFINSEKRRGHTNSVAGVKVDRTTSSAPRTAVTTLFSFGYWGSGSATKELVAAVDEVEASRGFEPPFWVDIRISRSVRAAGFRDHEFEQLLPNRYVWMKELGNKRVEDHRTGIEIQEPVAAKKLLALALEKPKRRVIFFCACERPASCHRKVVGELVLKYAKEQHAAVQVAEWPGGEPETLIVEVPPATLRKIERGAKSLPIPSSMTVAAAAALPWGTIATLQAGSESTEVLMGPAQFNASGLHLRVFPDESVTRANVKDFRKEFGYSKLR